MIMNSFINNETGNFGIYECGSDFPWDELFLDRYDKCNNVKLLVTNSGPGGGGKHINVVSLVSTF